MDETFQKPVRDFQNNFPYYLPLSLEKKDVVNVIIERFPEVVHHLFYHDCFNKHFRSMMEQIMNGFKVQGESRASF